jgi:hypothetical protein
MKRCPSENSRHAFTLYLCLKILKINLSLTQNPVNISKVTTYPDVLYTGNGLKIQSINDGNYPPPDEPDLSA